MKSLNIREIVSRIIFWGQNIKYISKKHYYLTILFLLLAVVTVFTLMLINQRREIERKENIVRSFFVEDDTEISEGQNNPEENTGTMEDNAIFKIHLCGEIKKPGVYEIEKGSRIIDLINIAGGQTEDACLDALNLAQEVFDGQKVYVPSKEEVNGGFYLENSDPDGRFSGDSGYGSIVNINTASSSQLEELPGIGPVTAENIIEHRKRYGSFGSIEELMNVSGIGPKKFEKVKDLINI